MDIKTPRTDLSTSTPPTTQAQPPRTGQSQTHSRNEGEQQDVTVTLTGKAQELSKLEKSLGDIPEVDSAKVQALRDAIAEGSYDINPGEIAQRLISFENNG